MPQSARFPRLMALCAMLTLACLTGCMTMMVASAELDEESVQRTQTKDHDARMKRMHDGGSVRQAEYDAMNNKMGGGTGGQPSSKPTIEELERRLQNEQNR